MGARLTRALSRIPDQFRQKPFYQQLITAIVNRSEESDAILADLATKRWLDTAEGVWLDTVGEIIGIPRFYEPITEGIFTYNGLGPELLVDGDAEDPGVGAWLPRQTAVLSKNTIDPPEGLRWLEVQGDNSDAAGQNILTVGKRYRAEGVGKGEAATSSRPAIVAGTLLWSGEPSDDWQPFSVDFTATASTIYYWITSSSAGVKVGFDAMTVREILPGDSSLGYSGLPAPGAGGIYNSVNGLFSDQLIDDDTYRRYIKAKAKATGTPGTLTDIYTFVKEAFEVESIVTTSGIRQVTVQLLTTLTQGQILQIKRWAPVSAAVSIRVLNP